MRLSPWLSSYLIIFVPLFDTTYALRLDTPLEKLIMMLGVSSHAKKTYCTDNTILTYLDISILLLCTYIAKLLNSYFQIYINSLSRKYILFYCKNYDDFIEKFSRGFVIFNIRYQKEGYFGNFLFGFTLDIYLLLILTFIFLFREIFVWEPKPAWIGFII